MEEVLAAVHGSVRAATRERERGAWSEEDHAMRMRRIHEEITRTCTDQTPAHETIPTWRESLHSLSAALLWLTPACENAVDVASAFNGAQVTGIVLCKLIYLVLYDCEPGASDASPDMLFAGIPELQTSTTPCMELPYSGVCKFAAALQGCIGPLLRGGRARDAGVGVAFLCGMYGRFFCGESMHVADLDDLEARELVSTSSEEYSLSKKAARRASVLVFCLLRECALDHAAQGVELHTVSREDTTELVRNSTGGGLFAGNLTASMRVHVQRVKRRLVIAHSEDLLSTDHMLWDNVVKYIGSDRMGVRPRKMRDALRALLRDICVVQKTDLSTRSAARITDCFVRVLVRALENYYVVPSAGTYRTVQQLETLLPGQRLGYSFENMHFDTGQLSQVIFFNNPVAKQKPPPVSVASWDPASAAGPISAFVQLDQQIRIHGADVQDPLGVRGEQTLIARPADALPVATGGTARGAVLFGTCSFVVAAGGTYLVDRRTHLVFRLGAHTHPEYPYLVLVAEYVLLAGLTHEICGIAVNSCKLAAG